jgi:hypothetical protein
VQKQNSRWPSCGKNKRIYQDQKVLIYSFVLDIKINIKFSPMLYLRFCG